MSGLVNGLQNRLQQFESARNLSTKGLDIVYPNPFNTYKLAGSKGQSFSIHIQQLGKQWHQNRDETSAKDKVDNSD